MLPLVHPAARAQAQTRPVTLLVWHDIVSRDKLVWFDTTEREFDAQLNRLSRAGIHPITLDALYNYLANGTPAPPPGAAVLCFDDNTVGIRDFAVDRLIRLGWPFALSAHTAYVGVTTGKAHNTWDDLRQMQTQGATIVSQTHTHPPDLRDLAPAALSREMTKSRQLMTNALGRAPRFVTYPSGKWNGRIAEAAQKAGYQLGLTEDNGAAQTSPHLLGIHRYSTHKRFAEAITSIAHASGKR